MALTSRLQNFLLETADYVTSDTGQIVILNRFYEWIDSNQRKYNIPGQFGLTVFNQTGRAIFYKSAPTETESPAREGEKPASPPNMGVPSSSRPDISSLGASGMDPAFPSPPPLEDRVIVKNLDNQYRITSPIHFQNSVIGTIAVSYSKKELTNISQQYGLISSLLLLSGLLGWLILYLLLRKLSKPIYEVVQALKQIHSGDYRLMLQENVKQQDAVLFVRSEIKW